MSLGEFLSDLVSGTVPPHDASPQEIYSYRWRITLLIWITLFGMIGLGCRIMGWPPEIFSPMATVDDVSDNIASLKRSNDEITAELASLRQALASDRASTLDQQLFDLRVLNCRAANDTDRTLYRGRIEDLEQRYYNVTGREYALQPCSDFEATPP